MGISMGFCQGVSHNFINFQKWKLVSSMISKGKAKNLIIPGFTFLSEKFILNPHSPPYPHLGFLNSSPQMSKFRDLKIFSCQAPYNFASNKVLFYNFRSFLTNSWVFLPRKLQKTLQKSSLWCHFRYVSSL